jgi:hypothetical protein
MAASGPVGGQRAAGQDVQVAASGPVGVYSSPDAELRELQVGLWSAIYSHNRDMVYQLLRPRHCHGGPGEAKGADIEDLRGFGTDQNWGGGALHWAVQLGYGTIVLLLLSLGADCRRKDRKNRTPYELIHDKCSVRRIPGEEEAGEAPETGDEETGEEETGEAIDKSGRWLVLVVLLTVMTACVVAGAVILGQVERLLTEKFRSRLLMLSYRLGECVVSPWRLFLPRDS